MTQQMAPQDQEHPLVGQTVAGRYKVVRLLGEGGMGAVYLAEQQMGGTSRKVALKTLHKHLSHDPSIKARFEREVETVVKLEHPNTIQVFDFGAMDDGTLFIVMEYVQGQSVADILIALAPKAMEPARVEHILKQVCGSLEEAHGHGIVHRDLKPDNIVLCERAGQKDWVEVLDFGIAKRSSEHDPNEAKLTQQGMVLGTPPYMSPEQFTGQPVDVRSDIYALGVMAYEMLSGKLPWEANTAWEWASKHMTEMPTPLERQPLSGNVPQHMRDAIARALAKNKDERFSSVKEFFAAFSGGTAIPALAAAQANAPNSGGQPPRAKTEMATPAMGGGPPMGAPTPYPAGPPMGTPPPGGGGPVAAVPPGPQHMGAPKKGNTGLIVGLGAVAVLLIAGAGIAAVASKKKPTPVTTDLTSTSASADTSASPSAAEDTSAAPTVATPLTPGTPQNPNTGGGTTRPSAGHAASIPTPKPSQNTPPPMTEQCERLKRLRQSNQPPAIVERAVGACRNSGGDPDKAR